MIENEKRYKSMELLEKRLDELDLAVDLRAVLVDRRSRLDIPGSCEFVGTPVVVTDSSLREIGFRAGLTLPCLSSLQRDGPFVALYEPWRKLSSRPAWGFTKDCESKFSFGGIHDLLGLLPSALLLGDSAGGSALFSLDSRSLWRENRFFLKKKENKKPSTHPFCSHFPFCGES